MSSAAELLDRNEDTVEDDIVVLHDVSWDDFKRILKARGDHSSPRIAYLEGELEIMCPSIYHEGIGGIIGRLVEAWCMEKGIEFRTLGSWTVTKKASKRGAEPDECYVFGDKEDPKRPDLAIEVIWTHWRLDKLDIYRKLGVREVWIWENGSLDAHRLRKGQYEKLEGSEVLPGIDLALIASLVGSRSTSQAIRDFQAAIRR